MSLVQQLQDIDEHAAVALSVTDIMAYKHIARMVGLRPRAVPEAKLSGGYVSKIKGRGMEFDEVRHYQAGDDIRSIDWRVTARTGKTHTKVYREERERPVYIRDRCRRDHAVWLGINAQISAGWPLDLFVSLGGQATRRSRRWFSL